MTSLVFVDTVDSLLNTRNYCNNWIKPAREASQWILNFHLYFSDICELPVDTVCIICLKRSLVFKILCSHSLIQNGGVMERSSRIKSTISYSMLHELLYISQFWSTSRVQCQCIAALVLPKRKELKMWILKNFTHPGEKYNQQTKSNPPCYNL